MLSKDNKFYFIAGSLATIALLTSLVLINTPNSLIIAIAALSAVALVLLYKIISNNRKMENKFDQREQELRNELTLEREATRRGIEELNSQLQEKEKWLSEELEKAKDQLKRKERMLFFECQELCSENERLKNNLQGQSLKMQRKLIELQNDSCELFFKFTVKEKLLKMMSEKKNARIEQLEKQLKEKDELCQEIRKISKDREILGEKIEELHREDALNKELSEQQYEVKEITRKNEYLSKELKKKFEELDKANGLIEDQFSELDKIRKNYSNEVGSLKNLLLKRDGQIEQLKEDLKKEKDSMQLFVVDITKKLITDSNKSKSIQVLEFVPQEEAIPFSPGKKFICLHPEYFIHESREDSGCESPNSYLSTKPSSLLCKQNIVKILSKEFVQYNN